MRLPSLAAIVAVTFASAPAAAEPERYLDATGIAPPQPTTFTTLAGIRECLIFVWRGDPRAAEDAKEIACPEGVAYDARVPTRVVVLAGARQLTRRPKPVYILAPEAHREAEERRHRDTRDAALMTAGFSVAAVGSAAAIGFFADAANGCNDRELCRFGDHFWGTIGIVAAGAGLIMGTIGLVSHLAAGPSRAALLTGPRSPESARRIGISVGPGTARLTASF